MATLTLKNVPPEVLGKLKAEAERNRRSLNQETLARLEQSLAVRWPTAEEKVRRIRAIQARFADLESIDEEFLRLAREEGRP